MSNDVEIEIKIKINEEKFNELKNSLIQMLHL